MAYELNYWEKNNYRGNPDDFDCLKTVRIKSIEEVQSLSLPHNRPDNTNMITLDRTDRQSNVSRIIWKWPDREVNLKSLRFKKKVSK